MKEDNGSIQCFLKDCKPSEFIKKYSQYFKCFSEVWSKVVENSTC